MDKIVEQVLVSIIYATRHATRHATRKCLRIFSLSGCRPIIKKKVTHLSEQAPTVCDFLFYCMAYSLRKVSLQ